MKTKEDILKEKAGIYQFTNGWTFEDEQKLIKAIHEAMEEYAEQFRLFDFSFINVDCQICGANSKIDEVEESICPKCGGIILIPVSYE